MGDGCRLKVPADFAVTMLDQFGKYVAKGRNDFASTLHIWLPVFSQCGSAGTKLVSCNFPASLGILAYLNQL